MGTERCSGLQGGYDGPNYLQYNIIVTPHIVFYSVSRNDVILIIL